MYIAVASHTFLLRVIDSTEDTIFRLMCSSACGVINEAEEQEYADSFWSYVDSADDKYPVVR